MDGRQQKRKNLVYYIVFGEYRGNFGDNLSFDKEEKEKKKII